jgi:hypothetical protein
MSCPAKHSDYVKHGWASFGMQLIPFIGPSLTGYLPKVSNQQSKLDAANTKLDADISDWQKEITAALTGDITNLNNLLKVFTGDPSSGVPGYTEIVADYVTEPLKEQILINQVNIVFLSLTVSLIISYLLSTKTS